MTMIQLCKQYEYACVCVWPVTIEHSMCVCVCAFEESECLHHIFLVFCRAAVI